MARWMGSVRGKNAPESSFCTWSLRAFVPMRISDDVYNSSVSPTAKQQTAERFWWLDRPATLSLQYPRFYT